MVAAVLTCALAPQVKAADFFPLRTGDAWVYEDSGQSLSSRYDDHVGNVQEVGGGKAVPIISVVEGKIDGSTFYRVTDDTVYVVAFDQNKPLGAPYPILKVGDKANWEYVGETQWYGAPAPLTVKGKSKRGRDQDVLGVKREILEVTLEASIGPPDGTSIKSKQVALYAKGVGLYDLKETQTIGKRKIERHRRLLSFTPAES
ncbi:MAG: hypothetical protein KIT11_10340 [Fimbriimonadaceae bacterium]|nr:hypothetical protein [Fimbriimonadaceae bacterium]QYK55720.1 MAG: hypothetical protein KF733_12010 [Fimbriimonadaceae bacterium]